LLQPADVSSGTQWPEGASSACLEALLRAEERWRMAEATGVWCTDAAESGALRAALTLYEQASVAAAHAWQLTGVAATRFEPTAFGSRADVAANELRARLVALRDDVNRVLIAARASLDPQAATRRGRRALLALGLLVATALAVAHDRIGDALELGVVTRDASWQASSAFPGYAISGALPGPSGADPFFFHTAAELSASLTIDLKRETPLRRAIIRNRSDCCGPRALPLALELSRDQLHWQQVALRTRSFDVWRTSFSAQRARWVRLRVLRRSLLHLASVVLRG
jgi:hypothetical protein